MEGQQADPAVPRRRLDPAGNRRARSMAVKTEPGLQVRVAQKSTALSSGAFFWYDRVCKPGSVLTAIYLDLQLLAGSSRLHGTVGPTICSSTALLRIEFTS